MMWTMRKQRNYIKLALVMQSIAEREQRHEAINHGPLNTGVVKQSPTRQSTSTNMTHKRKSKPCRKNATTSSAPCSPSPPSTPPAAAQNNASTTAAAAEPGTSPAKPRTPAD